MNTDVVQLHLQLLSMDSGLDRIKVFEFILRNFTSSLACLIIKRVSFLRGPMDFGHDKQ